MTAVDQKAKQEAEAKAEEIPSGKLKSGRVWKDKSSKYASKRLLNMIFKFFVTILVDFRIFCCKNRIDLHGRRK